MIPERVNYYPVLSIKRNHPSFQMVLFAPIAMNRFYSYGVYAVAVLHRPVVIALETIPVFVVVVLLLHDDRGGCWLLPEIITRSR